MSSALLVLAGSISVLGCGSGSVTGPDDPSGPAGTTGPNFVEDPESSSLAVVPIADNFDPNTNMGTSTIDGEKGGILRVGRFTIYVPPGAFVGPASISLRVPDPSMLICDLEITPQPDGNFKVPIRLEADCKNIVGAEKLYDLNILWMNYGEERWEKKSETTVDEQNSRVSSNLDHFSTYGVGEGRAGW